MPTLHRKKNRAELKESTMRLGAVCRITIPVLILSYLSRNETTVSEITDEVNASDEVRGGAPAIDITSIRRVVGRLSRTYVPAVRNERGGEADDWEPVVYVTDHETDTWFGRDGIERPVGVVRLTEGGFRWATTVLASSVRNEKAGRRVFGFALVPDAT